MLDGTTHLVRETLALLEKRFPLVFLPENSPRKPLKPKIEIDLIERFPGIPKDLICKALLLYMSAEAYQEAVTVVGEPRIDLDGHEVGFVTGRNPAPVSGSLPGCVVDDDLQLSLLAELSGKAKPAEACATTG